MMSGDGTGAGSLGHGMDPRYGDHFDLSLEQLVQLMLSADGEFERTNEMIFGGSGHALDKGPRGQAPGR